MIELRGKVHIYVDTAAAYDAVSRVEAWPEWWSAVERATAPSGLTEPGDAVEVTLRPHKLAYRLRGRVSRATPGKFLTLAAARRGVRAELKWVVEPQEDGCRVQAVISLGGPMFIPFRMLGQVEALALMLQRQLNGLKSYLEQAAGEDG